MQIVMLRGYPSTGPSVSAMIGSGGTISADARPLPTSRWRVVVDSGSQLVGTFAMAGGVVDSDQPIWHVVNVRISPRGRVAVTRVQQFAGGGSVTILRPPYGAKPPRRLGAQLQVGCAIIRGCPSRIHWKPGR
jgi:hypothetical protein